MHNIPDWAIWFFGAGVLALLIHIARKADEAVKILRSRNSD